jgi:UDP-N-acetyl-D-mannosaminuronic acid dehydrogenase
LDIQSVCVIGLGYIGLPTAAVLASAGYRTMGVDLNPAAVDAVNRGRIHIVEPDLEPIVESAVASGRLRAFTSPHACDVYVICVPTPFRESEGNPEPDINYVLSATRSIANIIKPGNLLILESTSPVGTTELLEKTLKEAGVDTDEVHIAHCPERVLPGNIMREIVENDRIVGGLTPEATEAAASFYRTFVSGRVLGTDAKTAEMCKLTENSFRDVNIAFANELSLICAKEGIDVWTLIQLANRHPRVEILQPGAGVGGHCIAVDPWFIISRHPERARLIKTAREVNQHKTQWAINEIKIAVADSSARMVSRPKIACLGLAFKPDIDDLRESPAAHIADSLAQQGFQVMVVEPNITSHDRLNLVTLEEALATADVLAVLVKHREFVTTSAKFALRAQKALDFCGALA